METLKTMIPINTKKKADNESTFSWQVMSGKPVLIK